MRESEATTGTKLLALVIAQQVGTTMTTQLKHMQDQADPSWEVLMGNLQLGVAEYVKNKRLSARRSFVCDIPVRGLTP